jgi:hypothetical protein
MPESLEPKLSENDQPKDSSDLNPVSSKIQGQKPIKGNVASIATLQKKFRLMDKTQKSIVFATGAAIILLSGFWPTGKSDILGGTMSVRCGVLHWNQKITFEGITLTCDGVESDGVENRNDYWIEIKTRDKDNREIYDIVAPRSAINLQDHSYLSSRVTINIARIDPEKPVRHSIDPNYKDSNVGQKIWGHHFSFQEESGRRYILVVGQSMFNFSGSNHQVEVFYNGRTHNVNISNHSNAYGGYLIPIESGEGIDSNAPVTIGLQLADPKYVK